MKMPNGYGSVYKLSGKRRKPFVARKTTGWSADAKTQKSKQQYITIGYFTTRQEALQALAEFNKNPFSIQNNITFSELYDKWSEAKFQKISDSNIKGYEASYKLCSDLYKTKFNELKLSHLQAVVDNSGKSHPTLRKLKVLFNQLFDYAVQNEVISKDKHMVEYLDIGKATKSDKHYRFTDNEINVMWEWSSNNEYIQVILMLIYSGVRPGELFNLKRCCVNLDNKYFTIEKGKNDNATRRVPIHDRTFPFFEHWYRKGNEYLITQLNGSKINFDTNHKQFVDTYWTPLLSDMGILKYKNESGEEREHTPDDTRHTFTTIWHEKHLDEAFRRKIQGHSGKGIGEFVYTHLDMEKLREELNKL